jgi:hypothetical protein
VEAIAVDRRLGHRVLIGTGGGRLRDAAGERIVGGAASAIFACDGPAGRWSQRPVSLPRISAIVAL